WYDILCSIPDADRCGKDAGDRLHTHGGISSPGWSRPLGTARATGTGQQAPTRLPARACFISPATDNVDSTEPQKSSQHFPERVKIMRQFNVRKERAHDTA